MKKATISIAVSVLATITLAANEVNDLQQKTNYILIKKVKTLESKIEAYKLIQTRNQLDIQEIKKKIGMGDNKMIYLDAKTIDENSSNTMSERNRADELTIAHKVIANQGLSDNSSKENTSIGIYDYKNLYKVNKNCRGYSKKTGNKKENKVFKNGSYVLIIENGEPRSKAHTGVWLNNSCFNKIEAENIGIGEFYKVGTYMANSRNGAGTEYNVESVFMKNDILFITGKKNSKENGVWLDIENDGYINQRIVKPIGN